MEQIPAARFQNLVEDHAGCYEHIKSYFLCLGVHILFVFKPSSKRKRVVFLLFCGAEWTAPYSRLHLKSMTLFFVSAQIITHRRYKHQNQPLPTCLLPALVPVGCEQDQYFPAVSVQIGEHAGETVLQGLLDTRVGGFQVLEHVQVLLSVLKILCQQPKRLEVVEFPRPEESEDERVVCPEETNVRPGDDHVPDLLDVLV